MKIEKYLSANLFCYGENYVWHGLLNDNNKSIGYFYQCNKKGFWIINNIYI